MFQSQAESLRVIVATETLRWVAVRGDMARVCVCVCCFGVRPSVKLNTHPQTHAPTKKHPHPPTHPHLYICILQSAPALHAGLAGERARVPGLRVHGAGPFWGQHQEVRVDRVIIWRYPIPFFHPTLSVSPPNQPTNQTTDPQR